jgi:ribosome-associated protein
MNSTRLLQEVNFKTALSGGPGGQHVNKTETKVILEWEVAASEAISAEQIEMLLHKLKNNINKEGVLQMNSTQTRSQHKNKRLVVERFLNLIKTSLQPKKKRKPTRPSKAAKLKRLKKKKINSDKKANRRKPDF